MSCLWCGRPSEGAAACLRCAPGQGHARDLEHDAVFEPDATYDADIENLQHLLRCYGIAPIELQPPDREFDDLNEERFFQSLAESLPARVP